MAYERNQSAFHNLNYFFHVDYFQGLDLIHIDSARNDAELAGRNKKMLSWAVQPPCLDEFCTHALELKTTYPGLLAGAGMLHSIGAEDEFSLGFSFDYVTGSPYIPGSSVKGALKSAFQNHALIRSLLAMPQLDTAALTDLIFEGQDQEPWQRDIFFDAFPCPGQGPLLAEDNLAPHGDDCSRGPNIIRFVKVRPNVRFRFCFQLRDSQVGDQRVTADDKLALFEMLIMLMGLGAKTNVGYGAFTK